MTQSDLIESRIEPRSQPLDTRNMCLVITVSLRMHNSKQILYKFSKLLISIIMGKESKEVSIRQKKFAKDIKIHSSIVKYNNNNGKT